MSKKFDFPESVTIKGFYGLPAELMEYFTGEYKTVRHGYLDNITLPVSLVKGNVITLYNGSKFAFTDGDAENPRIITRIQSRNDILALIATYSDNVISESETRDQILHKFYSGNNVNSRQMDLTDKVRLDMTVQRICSYGFSLACEIRKLARFDACLADDDSV